MNLPEPAQLLAAAVAMREILLADDRPTIAVRLDGFTANQRVKTLIANLAAALTRSTADDLKDEAKARITAQLAQLQQLAIVYYGTEIQLANTIGPEKDAERVRLTKANRDNDKKYFPWVEICFGNHPTLGPIVTDIRKKMGHKDDAEDVVREFDLLTTKPLPAGLTLPFTAEELAKAAEDATAFLLMLENEPAIVQEAVLLRQKAYARLVALYEELRAFGLLLTRDDPEKDTLFPAFNAG